MGLVILFSWAGLGRGAHISIQKDAKNAKIILHGYFEL